MKGIVLLLLLSACSPAEPAKPDWGRCSFDIATNTEERTTCCYASGEYDCRVGFQAVEVLHGPPNAPQAEGAAAFEFQCNEMLTYEGADLYCAGYCDACPEYRSYYMRYPDTPYAGEYVTGDDWLNDCYCSD